MYLYAKVEHVILLCVNKTTLNNRITNTTATITLKHNYRLLYCKHKEHVLREKETTN